VVVGAAVVDVGAVRFFAGCPDPPPLHAARTTAAQTATARSRRGRNRRVDVAADVPLVPTPEVGPTVSLFSVYPAGNYTALASNTISKEPN
jgi:hypothetical protein